MSKTLTSMPCRPKHLLLYGELLLLLFSCLAGCQEKVTTHTANAPGNTSAVLWLTTPDKSALFEQQNTLLVFSNSTNQLPTIEVDDTQTYQTMDGFGYTLTGSSAMLLHQMNPAARAALLGELFRTDKDNIGVSYLRLSIGASDLDDRVFSYNDLPAGETDPGLEQFSLEPDLAHLIPVLKEILAINPATKIMGSPWSPSAWMKTNNSSKGGSLKAEYHDAYASYLVKLYSGHS